MSSPRSSYLFTEVSTILLAIAHLSTTVDMVLMRYQMCRERERVGHNYTWKALYDVHGVDAGCGSLGCRLHCADLCGQR